LRYNKTSDVQLPSSSRQFLLPYRRAVNAWITANIHKKITLKGPSAICQRAFIFLTRFRTSFLLQST